jgi:Bacterial Ig-like domain (group 3)/Domain of unknown function (DUF5122) beta-propeller
MVYDKSSMRAQRASAWLCTAVAALVAVSAWADGQLDNTFGPNGVVKLSYLNSARGYLYGAQPLANGTVETAGFEVPIGPPSSITPSPSLFVTQLSSAGDILTGTTPYSQAAINGPRGLVVDPNDGGVFVVGSNVGSNGLQNATAVWVSAAGGLRDTYSRTAASSTDQSTCNAFRPILDNAGRLIVACAYGDPNGSLHLAALRLIPHTAYYKGAITAHRLIPDTTLAGSGFVTVALPAGYNSAIGTAIAQDSASGAYYVAGVACTANCLSTAAQARAQVVARLNAADGSLDTSYGIAGFAIAFAPSATAGSPEGITLDSSGRVVIGGNVSPAGSSGTGFVARLTTTGAPDSAFGVLGLGVVQQGLGTEVVDVATDAIDRVYALDHGTKLFRLLGDGTPDTSFSSSLDVQTLNGSGSAWQSLQFADNTYSSAYVAGGVAANSGCVGNCATTGIVAKVTLIGNTSATTLSSSPTIVTLGQPVTFTATVAGTKPTGMVTFKDGAATLGTASLAGGTTTVSLTTSGLAVGSHNIKAVYGGDANNGPSASAIVTVTVNVVASSTSLAVTPITSTVGQSVTLTATVVGLTPTGSVTFQDGTAALATVVLVGGLAPFTSSGLAAGSHTITAVYSGDANNGPSASANVTAIVRVAASSTALTVTPATSTVGQSVTLTATVTGVGPTGTVTFTDGMTTLGTGSLSGPTAAFMTSGLAVGSHSITATYGGDANNASSTSGVVMETVSAVQSGGGGGGGAFDLLALCALLLTVLARVTLRDACRLRSPPRGSMRCG